MVSLEQADGAFHLETSLNPANRYGCIGDAYRAGYVTSFTGATTPNTNLWNGTPSGVSITNIGAAGSTMKYNVDLPQSSESTEITFDKSLKITGNIITGLDYLNTTVQNMKSKIDTEYIILMYNNKNELLEDTQNIGTGGKIVFKDSENQTVAEYSVVLYGDVNGDGKINSIDLLLIQRHILRLQTLDTLYLKAGNTAKDGKAPSAVDLLRIQRHILRIAALEQ